MSRERATRASLIDADCSVGVTPEHVLWCEWRRGSSCKRKSISITTVILSVHCLVKLCA